MRGKLGLRPPLAMRQGIEGSRGKLRFQRSVLGNLKADDADLAAGAAPTRRPSVGSPVRRTGSRREAPSRVRGLRLVSRLPALPSALEWRNRIQDKGYCGDGWHRGVEIDIFSKQCYQRSEGTHKVITKQGGAWEVNYEGKYEFVGGTGRFNNLKGQGNLSRSYYSGGSDGGR